MARTLRRKAKRRSDRGYSITRSVGSTGRRVSVARVWVAHAWAIVALLVVAAPRLASGQTSTSADTALDAAVLTAALVIDEPGETVWRAGALQRTLVQDLQGIPEIDVIESPAGEPDIVLRGTLDGDRLAYRIYLPGRAPARPLARGSIALRGIDRAQVTRELRRALDSVVEQSSALEESAARSSGPAAAPAVLASPPEPAVILAISIAVACFLALPLCIGAVARRSGKPRPMTALTSFRVIPIVWIGIAAIGYGLASSGHRISPESWPISVVGGLAWGWLAALVLPAIFPSMGGLHRIEYSDLFRVSSAWLIVSLERAVVVGLFYLPFAVALWLINRAIELDDYVAVAAVIPIGGLVARLWYLSLVESLSLWLDSRLVARTEDESGDEKSHDSEDPWTEAARAYFMGYVRRAGWPADDNLVDGMEILPGHGDRIITYGGGLTHSRVVIGIDLLKMALAPCGRPHDYAAPRVSRLQWDEWNAGLVVPVEMYATVPSKEQRQPRHTTVPGETERVPLGQPPTLASYVEPDPLDLREAHRPTDDPLWLDWDPGEEHDGTDPSDKDFLFGALVRELGVVRRGDQHAPTIVLAIGLWLGSGSSLAALSRIVGWIGAPYRMLFARYRAVIGDGFATFNFAHNHLVQYLAWRFWQRDDVLTARAYAPELEQQSADIFAILGRESTGGESGEADQDLRDRLLWLSEHGSKPVRSRRSLIARRLALAGLALAGLIAIAAAVKQASDYHPTYIERIDQIESQKRASDSDVTK